MSAKKRKRVERLIKRLQDERNELIEEKEGVRRQIKQYEAERGCPQDDLEEVIRRYDDRLIRNFDQLQKALHGLNKLNHTNVPAVTGRTQTISQHLDDCSEWENKR